MNDRIARDPAVDAARVSDYTQRLVPSMLEELERYVRAESGSGDRAGIAESAGLFTEALAVLGFTAREVAADGATHVVASREGLRSERLLVLIHLDTVWPRDTLQVFPFRSSGDRTYGPGVADMKGGWVILHRALQGLAAVSLNALPGIDIFMTADEELGSPTARSHIEQLAGRADWALVMEPARESGALVSSRGAVGALELETLGQTAHSITGRSGASAIHALARKIVDLEAITDRQLGVAVNVGLVRGGTARQVVPERAWSSIDLRAPSTAMAERALGRIRVIAERADVANTTAALTGGITRPAFEAQEGTARLFEIARAAATGLGLALTHEHTGAGSDGNFTAALGIPTLDGLGAHGFNVCSKDEYVLNRSLAERAALLAALIAHLPAAEPHPR